jgi:hypothetical protein
MKKVTLPKGPVNNGIAFKGRHCGSCKTFHPTIPQGSPLQMGLYWWDCQCKSTLTWEKDEI